VENNKHTIMKNEWERIWIERGICWLV